ncbi:MAG: DUF2502 domain-containing protein [Azonexus sp.]|jgi:hypothetical protein|nr:DUF2502 domain-containing protein [Azonexus sp.]
MKKLILAAFIAAAPLFAQADVNINIGAPGISIIFGSRDDRGYYWDGYDWRDHIYWEKHLGPRGQRYYTGWPPPPPPPPKAKRPKFGFENNGYYWDGRKWRNRYYWESHNGPRGQKDYTGHKPGKPRKNPGGPGKGNGPGGPDRGGPDHRR